MTVAGHAIAVCTPYWVVGYMGDQMTLYEGIWLSCYREQGVGSWVCSTYDTIRNLFEQPGERCNSVCNRGGRNSVLLFIAGLAVPVYWTLTLGGRGGAGDVLLACEDFGGKVRRSIFHLRCFFVSLFSRDKLARTNSTL